MYYATETPCKRQVLLIALVVIIYGIILIVKYEKVKE